MTSAYSINLNFNNTIPVKTDFTFKQGDKGITLNLATTGLDTTGTTAHIVFKRSNGTSVEAELTGQTGPSYSYTILGNEFEIPGVVVADLKLYNGDTQRVSTASFIFLVTGDTMDGVGGGTGGYSDQLEELSQEFSDTLEEYKDAFGDVGAVNPRGAYDSTADYNVLDLVSYQGSSYLCRTACKNKLPTNTTYWQVFASGGGGGTGDYDDLTDKPSINSVTLSGNKTTSDLGLFSGNYNDLTNKPTLFSGNYNDLTNKPTIPSDFDDLADVDMTGVTHGQVPAWDSVAQKYKPMTPSGPTYKTFAAATDEEIATMVALADAGIIDLYEDCGWRVGQEHTVTLSAIAASGTYDGITWSVGESQPAQTVTFVLMHRGLYELVTPVLDTDKQTRNTCSFVVGMKENMNTDGKMNATNTNQNSWSGCLRRNWCNGGFRGAIPSTLRSSFKQFKTITAQTYDGSTNQISSDYFALAAEKEVFGAAASGNSTEAAALTQFTWYETDANRIKKTNNVDATWYFRSPGNAGIEYFCVANDKGLSRQVGASLERGVSPFGCI